MSFRQFENKIPYKIVANGLLLGLVLLTMTGCFATLPKPSGSDSALLIVSLEIQRNLVTNKPDTVVITNEQNGRDYNFSSRDGKYYFFANLPTGTYKMKAASLTLRSGGSSTTTGNLTTTFSTHSVNSFPFNPELIAATSTSLQPGKIAYMGSIVAEGTAKFFPPGAVEISNVAFSSTSEEKNSALVHFKTTFKDSPWVSYLN